MSAVGVVTAPRGGGLWVGDRRTLLTRTGADDEHVDLVCSVGHVVCLFVFASVSLSVSLCVCLCSCLCWCSCWCSRCCLLLRALFVLVFESAFVLDVNHVHHSRRALISCSGGLSGGLGAGLMVTCSHLPVIPHPCYPRHPRGTPETDQRRDGDGHCLVAAMCSEIGHSIAAYKRKRAWQSAGG